MNVIHLYLYRLAISGCSESDGCIDGSVSVKIDRSIKHQCTTAQLFLATVRGPVKLIAISYHNSRRLSPFIEYVQAKTQNQGSFKHFKGCVFE